MTRDRNGGFSVAELLAALAVAGFTVTAGSVSLTRMHRAAEVGSAARHMASDLVSARMRAVTRQEPATVTVHEDDERYVIAPSGVVGDMPEGVDLALASGSPSSFTFLSSGLLQDPEPAAFVVTAHGESVTVRVTVGGLVRLDRGE